MGVLQRIGIVYILAALIAYKASRRVILAITIALLLGYWAVLSLGPLEPPDATIAAQGRSRAHQRAASVEAGEDVGPRGAAFDAAGALATALCGILVTPWVRARNVRMLTIAGMRGDRHRPAVGSALPDQQESLDQLVRRLHRGLCVRRAGCGSGNCRPGRSPSSA
jgi:hypothetical protein